jgi:uncharacterized protein (DUF1330 family)
MPKGYLIFTENVLDQDGMNVYSGKAIPSLMQSGGRVLVADPKPDVKEGSWHGPQTIVLEFDSVEAANAWYNSAEYQEAVPLRQAAAECNAILVPGFEMPGG